MPIHNFVPGLHGWHVLALGTLTGMVLHTTFVSSIVQYKALPRTTFGHLQSKQFPIYFAICIGLGSFLTYTTFHLKGCRGNVSVWAAATLGALLNYVYVGPETRKYGFLLEGVEKKGGELDAKGKEIKTRFGVFHGVSALLNMGMVGAVVANCLWVGRKWAQSAK